MDRPLTEQEFKTLFKKEFDKNYTSGAPRLAPHRHNAIDNLQINPADLLGWPVFSVVDATIAPTDEALEGTQRFQFDGTNLREWFRTDQTWYQIGSGGGGTPAGNNTNVQFNDSGSFGGEDTFTFNKATDTLTLDDGSAAGTGGSIITGGTSGLQILTGDRTGASEYSGEILIKTGEVSAGSGYSGPVTLAVGDATDVGAFVGDLEIRSGTTNAYQATGGGGDINLRGGNSGDEVTVGFTIYRTGYGDGGRVQIDGGMTGTGVGGSIYINSGSSRYGTSGEIQLNAVQSGNSPVGVISLNSGAFQYGGVTEAPNLSIGGTGFGGGLGVISIKNANTDPVSNNGSGGILYISGGALTFRGSAGTVTTVAPA